MNLTPEDLQAIDSLFESKCRQVVKEELDAYFDPDRNELIVPALDHFLQHDKLSKGCLHPDNRPDRIKDHDAVSRFRKNLGGVEDKTVRGSMVLFGVLLLIALVFVFPPLGKFVSLIFKEVKG